MTHVVPAATAGQLDPIREAMVSVMKEAFSRFDKNGDGHIDANEFGDIMRSLGLNPEEEDLFEIVDSIDSDGNGKIDMNEFMDAMLEEIKVRDADEELMEAFKVFDQDGNGTISPQELRQMLAMLGDTTSNEDLDHMIKQVDKNGDGTIDFHEFASLMKQMDGVYDDIPEYKETA